MAEKKLTPKQAMFIQEYLIDFNATQAAIRAGYSKKTARQIGEQNLSKLDISAAIQDKIAERMERTERTADEVITRLWKFSDIDEEKYDAVKSSNTKSTELLAKHYKLITDKFEHTGKDGKELFPELSEADRAILVKIKSEL